MDLYESTSAQSYLSILTNCYKYKTGVFNTFFFIYIFFYNLHCIDIFALK